MEHLNRFSTPLLLSRMRDVGLVLLSITFLPFSTLLTLVAQIIVFLGLIKTPQILPALYHNRQVKVLVTGVSMAKGLFLARSMYLGGCVVVGADFEKSGVPACGRFSKACFRFYSLKSPQGPRGKSIFFKQMLDIVEAESIDIWISCSGVATALEDAQLMQLLEKNTNCRCYQFNESATHSLDDKFAFMQTTSDIGLRTPEWYSLDSRQAVEEAYNNATRKTNQDSGFQYILKNVAMDDKTRGSLPLLHSNESDHMHKVLLELDVLNSKWIMQQFIPGREEYCTQSLIIDGQVNAFLSCPSESILMHYKQVKSGSELDKTMLAFTQTYALALFKKYGSFTGHLSFDFLALEEQSPQGITKTLLPIECNPRCHTAVVRFRGKEKELAAAYLSILPDFKSPQIVTPDERKQDVTYFWIAHDLVDVYLRPILDLLTGSASINVVLNMHLDFWKLMISGKDPTFEWWDPVPWFILNHAYWPARFIDAALRGVTWRQVNVSTGKIFES